MLIDPHSVGSHSHSPSREGGKLKQQRRPSLRIFLGKALNFDPRAPFRARESNRLQEKEQRRDAFAPKYFAILNYSPFISTSFALPSNAALERAIESKIAFSISSGVQPSSLQSSVGMKRFISIISARPTGSIPD